MPAAGAAFEIKCEATSSGRSKDFFGGQFSNGKACASTQRNGRNMIRVELDICPTRAGCRNMTISDQLVKENHGRTISKSSVHNDFPRIATRHLGDRRLDWADRTTRNPFATFMLRRPGHINLIARRPFNGTGAPRDRVKHLPSAQRGP